MTTSQQTILIVDSAPEHPDPYLNLLQNNTSFACQRLESETLKTTDIEECCQSLKVDCIILEVPLSTIDGPQLVDRLKHQMGWMCPPIVIVGIDDLKTAVDVLKAGAADYLVREQLTSESLASSLHAIIEKFTKTHRATEPHERVVKNSLADKDLVDKGTFDKATFDKDSLDKGTFDKGTLDKGTFDNDDVSDAQRPVFDCDIHGNTLSQELAEAMPQIVWRADAVGNVTYWNQRWYDYTGLTQEESLGLKGVNTLHPEDRDRTLTQWSRAIATSKGFEIEHRIRHRDGVYRWFINRGLPTVDSQGQTTGWLGTITDIDDQKQLETRFRLATRAVNGLVYDWDLKTNDIYRSEQLFDLIGIHPDEVPPTPNWWISQMHPDDLAQLYPRLQKACAGSDEFFMSEYRVRHREGHWVNVWERSCLVRDEHGQLVRIVGSTIDISDHKQVERELRQAQIQFEAALAAGSVYTWLWDIQANVVTVNQSFARLFGIDASTAMIKLPIERFLNAVHPDDQASVTASIDQAISNRDDYVEEFRVCDTTGEEHWVIARGRAEYAADGTPTVFPGALADITERRQAIEALSENEERFQTLANNISQFAWMADETGWIFWYNQRWFDYTGTTLDEMQGWGWQSVHHPEHVNRVVEHISHCFAAGKTWEDTFPIRSKEGDYRWFLSRAIPVRNDQGQVVQWFGTNTDITELRQTEFALQQATERLNVALKSMPITLFNQDRNLRYTWIYHSSTPFLAEEMLGKRDDDIVSQDSAQYLTQLKRQVMDTGEGLREEIKVMIDGCAQYYDLTIDPLWDSSNSIVGITCAAVDISQRARLEADRQQVQADLAANEARLRQSDDRLRLAIASASLGTWDWNLVTNQLIWDAGTKAMFGLRPDAECSIDSFFESLHPDDHKRVESVIHQALTENQDGDYDVEYRVIGLEDGVERWVKATGKVSFDLNGQPLRFVGMVLDITEQKQIEAQRVQLLQQEKAAREAAENANRIKDEFLAILSHELRSPLNPILGWARLLQTRQMDAEKTARALETIERNARLQTQLIDDLLDVAKILRGKLKLDIAVVDLTFVIESAIETVQSAIDAKKISLHASLPDIGRVRGDAARLQQVVWNLLSNAIKFTPQRGQITVQLLRVDACAHIQVTDTGKGIHPEFLPYIFESFRQEDTSITRQFGGLGLGLAIVRHLVEAHGGTITAKSPGEGQGTTFMVSLPLESPTPDQPSTHGDATADTDLSEVRVLAVEDNPDTLELLQICLAQYGAEIRIFDSAAAALDALKTFKPDVLLCDIGMPNMDGYTLMRTIRSLSPEQGGQIPAIALTAYVREEDCQKALENGFQTHLAKPVDPNLLALTIAKVATP